MIQDLTSPFVTAGKSIWTAIAGPNPKVDDELIKQQEEAAAQARAEEERKEAENKRIHDKRMRLQEERLFSNPMYVTAILALVHLIFQQTLLTLQKNPLTAKGPIDVGIKIGLNKGAIQISTRGWAQTFWRSLPFFGSSRSELSCLRRVMIKALEWFPHTLDEKESVARTKDTDEKDGDKKEREKKGNADLKTIFEAAKKGFEALADTYKPDGSKRDHIATGLEEDKDLLDASLKDRERFKPLIESFKRTNFPHDDEKFDGKTRNQFQRELYTKNWSQLQFKRIAASIAKIEEDFVKIGKKAKWEAAEPLLERTMKQITELEKEIEHFPGLLPRIHEQINEFDEKLLVAMSE